MHIDHPANSTHSEPTGLVCRYCGEAHLYVPLVPEKKYLCQRCGILMAQGSRLGADGLIAAVLAALALAAPAFCLPFVTVAKLGSQRAVYLLSSAEAFWSEHLPVVAIWTATCIMAVPLSLLVTLAGITLAGRLGKNWKWAEPLKKIAEALSEWAMPEVFVLSVLVSLTKLGSVVDVKLGPGFWCYIAMSLCLLYSWRAYSLGSAFGAENSIPLFRTEAAE